jgi:hypothetical protein
MRSAQPLTIHEAMVMAGEMSVREGSPHCYYWNAVWWRLHARESKNSAECVRFSRNQLALYRDMVARPEHYRKPSRPDSSTDWQWSGLRAMGSVSTPTDSADSEGAKG